MLSIQSRRAQNDVAILITLVGLLICGFLISALLVTRYYSAHEHSSTLSNSDYDSIQQYNVVRDASADPYLDENTYVLNYIANREAHFSRSEKNSSDNSDLSRGLLLYLPFDEARDSSVFSDKSGFGRNAACDSGECPISHVDGKKGSAVQFDGNNDLLLVPYAQDFTSRQPFTVSFWFKGTKQEAGQSFVSTWDGSPNSVGWEADIATEGVCNGMSFYVSEDGSTGNDQHRTYARQCNAFYQDGNWHQFVGVFVPGQKIELYMDNVLVGRVVGNVSAVDGAYDAHTPLRIGSGFGANADPYMFEGSMDELRIYNRALSRDDIRRLNSL